MVFVTNVIVAKCACSFVQIYFLSSGQLRQVVRDFLCEMLERQKFEILTTFKCCFEKSIVISTAGGDI